MKKLVLLPLVLPLLLSACGDAGGGPVGSSAGADLCFASIWNERLTGRPQSEAQYLMRPLIGEGKARIIEAGASAGDNSNAGRITVLMGRDSRVSRVYCG